MPFLPWTGSGSGLTIQPWQFYVKTYGAAGNGQVVTDGAITTGTGALACTTSTPFTNAAPGMPIHIGGAGGSAVTAKCTTIATVTDSGHVTLASNATSTVSNGIVYFGTDDTAAIRNAVNAAVAYAQANNGYAEVLFDPLMYIIGGAPVIGGATAGNAQIPLPINVMTANKVTLVFRGTLDQSDMNTWLQTTPQHAGTVLACARNDGTVDATNGAASVIGGPFAGYGANSAGRNTWDNMLPVIDGIGIMVPYNGTYGGFDFFGVAEANVNNAAVMAAAVPPATPVVPTMSVPNNISNFGFSGLRMPSHGNNINTNIDLFSCQGIVNGLRPSDATTWRSVRLTYCWACMAPYSGDGQQPGGTCQGSYTWMSDSQNGIYPIAGGDGGLMLYLDCVDTENILSNTVSDPSNVLAGTMGFKAIAYTPVISSATNLRMLRLDQPNGWINFAPAVGGSGSPVQNTIWKDASIVVHTGAGVTVSAISVDGNSTGLTMAASSSLQLPTVPAGKTVTLTYAGGTPTWDWWIFGSP